LKDDKSETQLAKKMGVSQYSINCWINRKHFPDSSNLKKIADYMDISIDQLLSQLTDILSLDANDWSCNWQRFWNKADWDCECIVKLTFRGKILGLIHFALYPYPPVNNIAEYLEILHIECKDQRNRLITPVGFWLIWYATEIALEYCQGNSSGSIVELDALEEAIYYYRDKVMMEEIGWTTIAPGEEGYAFKFSQSSAQQFCQRIEIKYGIPRSS
jgi:transcriptional regulator with XRE-family HTH domain